MYMCISKATKQKFKSCIYTNVCHDRRMFVCGYSLDLPTIQANVCHDMHVVTLWTCRAVKEPVSGIGPIQIAPNSSDHCVRELRILNLPSICLTQHTHTQIEATEYTLHTQHTHKHIEVTEYTLHHGDHATQSSSVLISSFQSNTNYLHRPLWFVCTYEPV